MYGLKIAVVGGGSSYTPELIDGFIKRKSELVVSEIWLVDVERGREKLDIVSALAERMLKESGMDTKIITTLDRKKALEGADFVLTQLRVGGMGARAKDEGIPLEMGVIGQETTGPGGYAKALRTIPVILEIAREMETLCPDAFLVNFTNPAGMVTEAVLKHTNIKIIGLCNVPIHMKNNLAKIMDIPVEELHVEFTGLNHLVWGRSVFHLGREITEDVLTALKEGASFSMKNIPDMKWNPELIESLGMVPCPYHRYFYNQNIMLEEELEAYKVNGTRAYKVMEIEKGLFEKYADPDLKTKPVELESRGGAYYSDAAVSLISAIHNDKNEIHTVNLMNNGIISNLPDHVVVEANAIINRRGAQGITQGDMPYSILGLVTQVKAYEELAIDCAVGGERHKGVMALLNNPLVRDAELAIRLEKAIFESNTKILEG